MLSGSHQLTLLGKHLNQKFGQGKFPNRVSWCDPDSEVLKIFVAQNIPVPEGSPNSSTFSAKKFYTTPVHTHHSATYAALFEECVRVLKLLQRGGSVPASDPTRKLVGFFAAKQRHLPAAPTGRLREARTSVLRALLPLRAWRAGPP